MIQKPLLATKYFEGKCGIGSMDQTKGLSVWQNVAANKMNLKDFISKNKEARLQDYELNDLLQSLKIPLTNDGGIIAESLNSQKPINIKELDSEDPFQQMLADIFNISKFAVIPLINHGQKIGTIIVDNNINQKRISTKYLDSIIPLATQAASAIENANIYFQEMLTKYFNTARENQLSLSILMLDIDYFKHYNDTNGHLAGNTS